MIVFEILDREFDMGKLIKFVKEGPYSIVVVIALALFCVLLISYSVTFSGGLSERQDVWGQFGDFMGGTLNPVLGFLTVIILISTLRMQRKELKDSRKAIKYNNRLIKNQLKTMREQSVESTIFKLIENLSSDAVVIRCKELDKRIYIALYAVKDMDIFSAEADDVFYRISGGVRLGEFRYVVVEKLAILSELIKGCSRESLYCKLVQTSVGVVLVSVAIQHAKDAGHSLYASFSGLNHLIRGLSLEYIYNEEVAKDFFVVEKFNKFLASHDDYELKRKRQVSEIEEILRKEEVEDDHGRD